MDEKELEEIVRRVVSQVLQENQPGPSPSLGHVTETVTRVGSPQHLQMMHEVKTYTDCPCPCLHDYLEMRPLLHRAARAANMTPEALSQDTEERIQAHLQRIANDGELPPKPGL